MTEAELIELAQQHGVDRGMYPPLRLMDNGDGKTMSFRHPPGLTPYGEKLLKFGVAVAAAERERCAKLAADPALCLIILKGRTNPAEALVNAIKSGLPAIRKGETP